MVYPSALFFFYCPNGNREQMQYDLMVLAQEVKTITDYDLFVSWSLSKNKPPYIQYAWFSRSNYFSFDREFHQEIEDKFISFYENSINCIGFLVHDFEIYKKFLGKEEARSVIYSNKYLAKIISSIILSANEEDVDLVKYDFLDKTKRSRYFPVDVWPILINQ